MAADDEATALVEQLRPRAKLVWLLACIAFILYLSSLHTLWNPGRDSALYLGVGRNLATGQGYTFNGTLVEWLSPGLPLLWAGIVAALGECYLAAQVFMVGCALLLAVAAYAFVKHLAGRGMAVLVAMVVPFSYAVFYRSVRLETDLPFAAFLMLAVLGFQQALDGRTRALAYALPALLASLAFRIVGLMVVPWLVAGLFFSTGNGGKWRGRIIAACAGGFSGAVFGVWYLVQRAYHQAGTGGYVEWGKTTLFNGLSQKIPQVLGTAARIPEAACELLAELHAPPLACLPFMPIILIGMLHEIRRRRRLTVILGLGYTATLTIVGRFAISDRYLLPLLPLVVYFFLWGCMILAVRLRAHWQRVNPRYALVGVAVVLTAVGLVKDIRDVVKIRRSSGPWVERRHWPEVFELHTWLAENTQPSEALALREHTVIAYWTKRRTYRLDDAGGEGAAASLAANRPDVLALEEDETVGAEVRGVIAQGFKEAGRVGPYVIYRRKP